MARRTDKAGTHIAVAVSVMVLVLQVTQMNPQGGRMYESPKLVRFGSFRELTLQVSDCTNGGTAPQPWTFKNQPNADSFVPVGNDDDGCPTVARS